MKGVQILGFKKTGKTTLCSALLGRIREQGLMPCALKFTHNPSLDKENTDTDQFMQHCQTVGAMTGGESAVFWNSPRSLPDMLPLLSGDVLVLEGGREHALAPRVLVLNDPADADRLSDRSLVLAVYGKVPVPGLPHVTTIDELLGLVLERGFVLPGLNCGACGRDGCGGLAADILAGRAELGDCVTRSGFISVRIGGVKVCMNPFVERMLRASIQGMLGELKGFRPGPVEIQIGCAENDNA